MPPGGRVFKYGRFVLYEPRQDEHSVRTLRDANCGSRMSRRLASLDPRNYQDQYGAQPAVLFLTGLRNRQIRRDPAPFRGWSQKLSQSSCSTLVVVWYLDNGTAHNRHVPKLKVHRASDVELAPSDELSWREHTHRYLSRTSAQDLRALHTSRRAASRMISQARQSMKHQSRCWWVQTWRKMQVSDEVVLS
ncbi:hypothetical protein LZ30DRAFT_470392 [Colletotrichum cereale]|nr:hypothetical protein LZ30DRAFT_470392 [Colletotrichum cereale]